MEKENTALWILSVPGKTDAYPSSDLYKSLSSSWKLLRQKAVLLTTGGLGLRGTGKPCCQLSGSPESRRAGASICYFQDWQNMQAGAGKDPGRWELHKKSFLINPCLNFSTVSWPLFKVLVEKWAFRAIAAVTLTREKLYLLLEPSAESSPIPSKRWLPCREGETKC